MIMLAGCAGAPSTQDTNAGQPQVAPSPHVAVAASAPTPVEKASAPAVAPARVDHYTVVKGDTLGKIAARPEVYGDIDLWPLLYRSNASQIRPGGLIYPGQVLNIDRTYSAADIERLKAHRHARSRNPRHWNPPGQAGANPPCPRAAQPAAPTATPKSDDASGTAYLDAARRAFEAGDIEWTLHYYNIYLKNHKNDADAWGELGNVYFSQGMMSESARSYYNSANILIDQGETSRAEELLPAIQDGNPELANSIYKRLPYI
jgi:tetratricopeptide (TPR) repeat protein